MQAVIIDKKEIATGTLAVKIDLKGEVIEFKPGQFFFITLPNIPYPDPKNGRRHFSIVNSPDEKGILEFATRIREESAFKKYLYELPLNSEVEVGPFSGKFVLPEDPTKDYVFIAGGIGITPFISMLRYIQAEKLPHRITLIYSNRDQRSTAFLEELQKMERNNPNLKLVLTMTEDPDWKGENSMINKSLIEKYLNPQTSYTFYIAGPPPMVTAVDEVLKQAGVVQEAIIKENFAGY